MKHGLSLVDIFISDFGKIMKVTFVKIVHDSNSRRINDVLGGFHGGSDGKQSACNVGDLGLIPGSGRSPGGGHAAHSSILIWRIPMDTVPWGHKESDMSK